jgi:cysteine-rich repeat protein
VVDVTGRSEVRLRYRRWLTVEDGFFDTAAIYADDELVWRNHAGEDQGAGTHHVDAEWRYHDVDLSAQAADGAVQVAFELAPDGGNQWGGWTLDDVCVMVRAFPGEICGDGAIGGGESCDDGNTVDGDGCSSVCIDEYVPPEGGCCSTRRGSPVGPIGPIGLGLVTLGLLLRRRRRDGARPPG